MTTLIKRIIFIAIILGIAYWIYWLIDRKWADELKENIVTTTQKTVESLIATWSTWENFTTPEELFDSSEEIIIEKNIIVNDPTIEEPTDKTNSPTPVVAPTPKQTTPSTPSSTTKGSSSNILFELFK